MSKIKNASVLFLIVSLVFLGLVVRKNQQLVARQKQELIKAELQKAHIATASALSASALLKTNKILNQELAVAKAAYAKISKSKPVINTEIKAVGKGVAKTQIAPGEQLQLEVDILELSHISGVWSAVGSGKIMRGSDVIIEIPLAIPVYNKITGKKDINEVSKMALGAWIGAIGPAMALGAIYTSQDIFVVPWVQSPVKAIVIGGFSKEGVPMLGTGITFGF